MKRRNRSEEAIAKARKVIEDFGWRLLKADIRYVAVKTIHEREDESTTNLYESDYTVEGLATNVTRREREEGRKA